VRITGLGGDRERETFPVPHGENGSKNSKWLSSSPSCILDSWWNTHGEKSWDSVAEMAVKTGMTSHLILNSVE
jgi:hypothetical protein